MRKKILVVIFLFFLSFTATKKVLASDAVALKVAPLFFDLNVNPGEQKTGQIYVENKSENEMHVAVEFSDFFIDDRGNYIFSDGKDVTNAELKPYLMKDWFLVDSQDFNLQKGENRLVKYTINVPNDTNLGGHYGTIFFKTDCQKIEDKNVIYSDKSSLCVSGRVGTLFLMTIGGDAVRKGEIGQMNIPRFTLSDKADFAIDVKNTGNAHFRPEGNIDVQSVTGNQIFHMDIKDKTLLPYRGYVLGGEIARSDHIGLYRLTGAIRDGDGNEMRFQRWMFMFPWKELSILVIAFGIIYWFRKKFEFKKIGR
jgi:hypothetical protein